MKNWLFLCLFLKHKRFCHWLQLKGKPTFFNLLWLFHDRLTQNLPDLLVSKFRRFLLLTQCWLLEISIFFGSINKILQLIFMLNLANIDLIFFFLTLQHLSIDNFSIDKFLNLQTFNFYFL